jgi:hypothetical protein
VDSQLWRVSVQDLYQFSEEEKRLRKEKRRKKEEREGVVTGLDKEKASTVKHILHPSRF